MSLIKTQEKRKESKELRSVHITRGHGQWTRPWTRVVCTELKDSHSHFVSLIPAVVVGRSVGGASSSGNDREQTRMTAWIRPGPPQNWNRCWAVDTASTAARRTVVAARLQVGTMSSSKHTMINDGKPSLEVAPTASATFWPTMVAEVGC